MANEEQVKRLLNNVTVWNSWRRKYPNLEIDLQKADLREVNLRTANLQRANLERTQMNESVLNGTNFSYANLQGVDFTAADLWGANLLAANMEGANLGEANLQGANLRKTKLSNAYFGHTILGDIDFSSTIGLLNIQHRGPSPISTSTLELSRGKIPKSFLLGCGLSDWEIESVKLYQPGLSTKEIDDILYRMHDLRAGQAIQINPLFISYSHKDSAFVNTMEKHLEEKGIRFWRDIHHATSGRLEKVVDHAMRQNPTVLLVLSENSVQSDWVEHEARSARDLEKELKRDVLCPVALDGAWKDCNWPARLREQIMEYNILDFSNWQDKSEFTRKFARLVEGLDLFYKEK